MRKRYQNDTPLVRWVTGALLLFVFLYPAAFLFLTSEQANKFAIVGDIVAGIFGVMVWLLVISWIARKAQDLHDWIRRRT
jgi:uncharacterized membrane protein